MKRVSLFAILAMALTLGMAATPSQASGIYCSGTVNGSETAPNGHYGPWTFQIWEAGGNTDGNVYDVNNVFDGSGTGSGNSSFMYINGYEVEIGVDVPPSSEYNTQVSGEVLDLVIQGDPVQITSDVETCTTF